MGLIQTYFKKLYERTMKEAYDHAIREISKEAANGGKILDCGAGAGSTYHRINRNIQFSRKQYFGIEIDRDSVRKAFDQELNIVQGDLNQKLPYRSENFRGIVALSVLEHLIFPCHFLREIHRILKRNGLLVIITPNISTFFTIGLLLVGKMPSSGPKPDSVALIRAETNIQVADWFGRDWGSSDIPTSRHLIVFSYRVLKKYLGMLGFQEIKGYGYGLYPFPNFMQPYVQSLDPYHCHQMVFIARK